MRERYAGKKLIVARDNLDLLSIKTRRIFRVEGPSSANKLIPPQGMTRQARTTWKERIRSTHFRPRGQEVLAWLRSGAGGILDSGANACPEGNQAPPQRAAPSRKHDRSQGHGLHFFMQPGMQVKWSSLQHDNLSIRTALGAAGVFPTRSSRGSAVVDASIQPSYNLDNNFQNEPMARPLSFQLSYTLRPPYICPGRSTRYRCYVAVFGEPLYRGQDIDHRPADHRYDFQSSHGKNKAIITAGDLLLGRGLFTSPTGRSGSTFDVEGGRTESEKSNKLGLGRLGKSGHGNGSGNECFLVLGTEISRRADGAAEKENMDRVVIELSEISSEKGMLRVGTPSRVWICVLAADTCCAKNRRTGSLSLDISNRVILMSICLFLAQLGYYGAVRTVLQIAGSRSNKSQYRDLLVPFTSPELSILASHRWDIVSCTAQSLSRAQAAVRGWCVEFLSDFFEVELPVELAVASGGGLGLLECNRRWKSFATAKCHSKPAQGAKGVEYSASLLAQMAGSEGAKGRLVVGRKQLESVVVVWPPSVWT
ncbi:hypothetical protein B0T20DRAFT_389800 [Sordaria brevicollis]|uniref:Uncharacterized protein n=1 Tax=Sordaria brevicollis TaxID=83679 RepID=A0AAE0PL21_SORBR|nr:hypothetical protein B0T20DRAFT_389800 [Sordaria brevicollis]